MLRAMTLAALAVAAACTLRFDPALLADAGAPDATRALATDAASPPPDGPGATVEAGRPEAGGADAGAPPGDAAPGCPEFLAGSATVTLPSSIGCDGNLAACVALVPPFLFVALADGVVAARVSPAPSPDAPRRVGASDPSAVKGVTRLVASGRRLFAQGPLSPAANPTHVSAPFLDVPMDAAAALAWRPALLNVPTLAPSTPMATLADALAVWPARDAGLYLVANWDGGNCRAALHPLASSDALAYPPIKLDGTDHVVASSDTRLLVRAARSTDYRLVAAAATPAATLSGALDAKADLPAARTAFVPGPGGAVLFAAHMPGASALMVRAVRAGWVLASEGDDAPDATRAVDVQVYAPPISTTYLPTAAGLIAPLDATTAVALAASAAAPTTTVVQLVVALPAPHVVAGRSRVLDVELRNAAVVGAGGAAIVVVRDPTAPTTLRLYGFTGPCR